MQEYDAWPSEYAGQEPEYENRSVMQTISEKKVIIVDYLKDKGLYVVMSIDKSGTISSAYKVSPDKLEKIEKEK